MSAIRESARGESCTVCSSRCNGDNGTVIWVHSNFGCHGKGLDRKALDIFGFYACAPCHLEYDTQMSRDDRKRVYLRANAESIRRLIDKGIITIKS